MATVSILMNQFVQAKTYIMLEEEYCKSFDEYDLFLSQCWCQYYVAAHDEKQALYWADHLMGIKDEIFKNKHIAFDIFAMIFDSMIDLNNQIYAKLFLDFMEVCHAESSDRCKQLEIARISFCIAFEKDEQVLEHAYKHYAKRICELEQIGNEIVTSGLKDALAYYYVSKQRKALENEKGSLDDQVNVDELTKVYTRRYLDKLTQDIPNRHIQTLGFIMLDVDCLKEFNDTYGHLEGDTALQEVGCILNSNVINGIYPCRFGGDEFVCMCIDVSDDELETYIQAVRYQLDQKHIIHETSQCAKQVTLSIGYANVEFHDQMDCKMVLNLADQALYTSKLHGRNTYSKYTA